MLESSSHTFLFSCSLADDCSHLYNADRTFSNVHSRGCGGVYSYLAGRPREMRSLKLEVLKLCSGTAVLKWEVSCIIQAMGKAAAPCPCVMPWALPCTQEAGVVSSCWGIPLVLTPSWLLTSISQAFSELQFPRVESSLKNGVRRTSRVLRYTTLCWFLSSLLCLGEAELLNYSDCLVTCSILTVPFSVILHKVLPSVHIISYRALVASSSQNEISCGW